MSRIHFIGGEKGGVGKSVVARLLSQYYIDRDIAFNAFDGDLSHGALMRYYPDFAEQADLSIFNHLDRIIETAVEEADDIIVDLPAQAHRPLSKWIEESGVLELDNEFGLEINFWHVMDDGTDSQRLLDELIKTYQDKPGYVVVRNKGRGKDFSVLEKSEVQQRALAAGAQFIDLPGLNDATMTKTDRVGASFWAAVNNKDPAIGPTLGMLERQRVKVWLKKIYEEFDRLLQPA